MFITLKSLNSDSFSHFLCVLYFDIKYSMSFSSSFQGITHRFPLEPSPKKVPKMLTFLIFIKFNGTWKNFEAQLAHRNAKFGREPPLIIFDQFKAMNDFFLVILCHQIEKNWNFFCSEISIWVPERILLTSWKRFR